MINTVIGISTETSQPMRVLVVYHWQEDFDLSKRPQTLTAWVEDLGLTPNKVSFFAHDDKERRRTIFKKSRLVDVVSEFSEYSDISLDDIRGTHYLNPNSHLTFSAQYKKYVVACPERRFSVDDEIRHLRMVCKSLTPRYGFSNVGEGAALIFATSGTASTSMSQEVWTRTMELGRMLDGNKEHLSSKLHDVYELNVLSPVHLRANLRGSSLGSWIEVGSRGQLHRIKDEVFAWVVPSEVRSDVRWVLFREGLLVASV